MSLEDLTLIPWHRISSTINEQIRDIQDGKSDYTEAGKSAAIESLEYLLHCLKVIRNNRMKGLD
jgi:hypothetical protein